MPAQRRWRMNNGSCHVGADNEPELSQQSGTEGHQAPRATFRRTVRDASKQNHAQTRTKPTTSKSNSLHRRNDDADHHRHHSQTGHASSSSSRIRPGRNDNEPGPSITPRSDMMGKTRSGPNIGSRQSFGQSISRDAFQLNDDTAKRTTKSGDKRKEILKRNMERMPGFGDGPSTVPARPTRRRVQKETGAVLVPVPGKGTRPSPVLGMSKEYGQANHLSRSSSREGVDKFNGSRPLYWDSGPKKKPPKRNFTKNIETTNIIDVDKDALDAERQKKTAMLKKITFSKRKVKEEVIEEEDVLRVGVDGMGGGGERREATVNGQVQREHSPWILDGQGNIPGLSTTSRSARIRGPYALPQAAGVESKAVPIPLPSLFPDPPDSVSDISDDDLYSPKVAKVGVDVQVKEEQWEDEDVFFGFMIPDDLQTISAPNGTSESSIPAHADNSASYPLDTECSIHPKNKRKQHGLSHAKNGPSPKKVKTGVSVLNEEPESNREAIRVQDEDGGEVSRASMPPLKKKTKGSRSIKRKGKEKGNDVPIDQAVIPVVTVGPEGGGDDDMVETKQGEIPTGDTLSLVASGGVGRSDSQTDIGKRKENESTGENAEIGERDERMEPSAPDLVTRKSSKKGKKKGRATENGTDKVPKRKRNARGQTTEAGEQTKHGTNLVGDEDISHPNETPRKKRKVQDQTTEGGPTEDKHIPQQEETMNNQTTEGGEKTEEDSAGDQHIPRQKMPRERTKMNDQTTSGGENTQSSSTCLAAADDIARPDETSDQTVKAGERAEEDPAADEETPRKIKDQATEGGERTEELPAGHEHIFPQEGTSKRKKEKDKTIKGGENVQGSSAAADDKARPAETPKKKGKAKDQSATDGAPEAKKKVVRKGRPPKEKKNNEGTTGETSLVKVTEENGPVNGKTPRGRKKRVAADEKDGTTDGVVRKKKVKLTLEEGGDKSGKTEKSTVKWTLVCKNRTATGRKASRQSKGKEKAQSIATTPDLDVDEEETDGNIKTRETLRPSIWASSKTELLLVLPELSGSKCFNGITEGPSNFPMVMLDESTAKGIGVDVRWFDGEESESSGALSVRLTLARDFVCPVPECTSPGGIMMDSAPSDAGPSSMTQPNVSLTTSGVSSVINGYGHGCGPLPVVLPHDDNEGIDLEYIDEDAPHGGAVATLSGPSVKMSPVSLTPIVPYTNPVAQEATNTAHISHKVQSFLQAPALPTHHPAIQFSPYNPTNLSTPSVNSIPSREATTTAHISHKVQSFLQMPTLPTYHPAIQFSRHNSNNLSTPSTISIPSREATTKAHISHQVQNFSQTPAFPTCHPVFQFGQHSPTNFSMPSTVPISSLQIQHLLPFHPDQQYGNTAPVPIPIPSKIPFYDEKPSPPTPPAELKSELDTIIPPSPPPEIEILTSSKRLSLPLILISSREMFKRHFRGPPVPPRSCDIPGNVGLAAEHAYVFLGFFRVVKMSERRVTLSDGERANPTPGKIAGRVEWTFDIEWVPGYHGPKRSEELSRPWWAPDSVFGRPVGRERGSKKGSTWFEKHGQARLNLLPMQLVDGQEAGSSDEAMPKGWLCKACGKLNQKVMMRHRWCGSRMCRDNPLSRGYAVDLSSARDANQTPLALPINTCNRRTVDASVADWDDGMRTLKYRPMSIPDRLGNPGQRDGILQHVFTCNLVSLQTEATSLFESIQSDVCLMKSTGDSGPFFKSHVSDLCANTRDKYAFSSLSWSEAPQAVKDAQELMTFMGKAYGEEERLNIDKLTIVGWVSSGTRKTPTILAAREHAIAMLCLGNDVILTIVPKWEVSAPVLGSLQLTDLAYPPYVPPEVVNPSDLPPNIPVLPRVANFTAPKIQSTWARTPRPIKPPNADQMQPVDVTAAPATEDRVRQVGAISENPPSGVVPAQTTSRNSRSKPASKLKPKAKQASESMSVTLVHGDMLLFSGCDFEYSIKRMGTSILVIGSKEDSITSI